MSEALRLARIVLICEDAASLAAFYRRAFGFAYCGGPKADPGLAELIGVAGAAAEVTVLRLGDELIALAQTLPRGRRYPADVAGWNPLFQHFAIVVSDMAAAYKALQATGGWTPISTDGPQVLPPSSGGVTAYKFRDPEGHPLELLAYPAGTVPAHWADRANRARGPSLGIDHSAISVADTERSVAFYAGLGLKRIASSLNQGIEQENLDGICSPIVVEVTAMAPAAQSTPHVELLCYRGRLPRGQSLAQPNDVASTRLVFDVASPLECAPSIAPRDPLPSDSPTSQLGSICMLRDPDGHLISLEIPQGEICRHMR
jgi:catechol 2,3-dioxygenase-like lactoylglutathione lyase family enzyme